MGHYARLRVDDAVTESNLHDQERSLTVRPVSPDDQRARGDSHTLNGACEARIGSNHVEVRILPDVGFSER